MHEQALAMHGAMSKTERPAAVRSRRSGRRIAAVAAGAIAVLAAGYLAAPYVALYRFGQALQAGNTDTVAQLVDWTSLRAGIASDVTAQITAPPSSAGQARPRAQLAANELPAFGTSFVSHIATNEINRQLTPDALARMASPEALSAAPDLQQAHLDRAFFDSPTGFDVRLTTASGEKLRLHMQLIGMSWKVTRAWLPPSMLSGRMPG